MSAKKDTDYKARIAFIGKFQRLHDEEYIARSFEMLGHTVVRIDQNTSTAAMRGHLNLVKPDILLFCKWECPKELIPDIDILRRGGMKTVCWLFDLYFGYQREHQVASRWFFKADYVFTTDGGHNKEFTSLGINHICIRQGIFKDGCYLADKEGEDIEVAFVGSDSPLYIQRTKMLERLSFDFEFQWLGRKNTNEVRGEELNKLFARTKVIVGDSYPSPYYWSNRVVETLGRGGFMIHRDIPGLKEEYPNIVTYDGSYEDLKRKILFYLAHEKERQEIVRKNFEWVRDNYTMESKCAELLSYI